MELHGDLKQFHDHMAIERSLSPRTALEYCRDVARFERWLDGKPLNDVKAKRVRAWLTSLMADGSNKPQSVHRKIAALKAYFKWLVREKRRKRNPVDEIEKPKAEKRLPKCMTLDEVMQILRADVVRRNEAHGLRDHAMLELMYGSGLRRAEVCGVNVGDFDAQSRVLLVVGKGNKQRAVFLSEPTIAAVQSYLATRPGAAGADPLFLTARRGRMKPRQLWVIFREYLKASGLAKHVTPHTMRHSFATHMIEAGADIVTIKELLGHASIATTQVYTNVSMPHMRDTFERTHPRAISRDIVGGGGPRLTTSDDAAKSVIPA